MCINPSLIIVIDWSKECGGGSICEHDRVRSQCKECGGSALCKSKWCETFGNKKYDGYCLYCYANLFPDKQLVRSYKTKERAVVDYIKNTFDSCDWLCDKKMSDGCSKRRPDMLLDLGLQVVIIEVDENQHADYDCTCENKRLMELSNDVGNRPIIFIRFNPDGYQNEHGERIPSCWSVNRTSGVLRVTPKHRTCWEKAFGAIKRNRLLDRE